MKRNGEPVKKPCMTKMMTSSPAYKQSGRKVRYNGRNYITEQCVLNSWIQNILYKQSKIKTFCANHNYNHCSVTLSQCRALFLQLFRVQFFFVFCNCGNPSALECTMPYNSSEKQQFKGDP